MTALEDKPFGQYWGLQAVGRNLETGIGDSTSKAIRQDLVAFAVRVPRGSDRDYEVRKIIARLSLST